MAGSPLRAGLLLLGLSLLHVPPIAAGQTHLTDVRAEDVEIAAPIVPLNLPASVHVPVEAPCRTGVTHSLSVRPTVVDAPDWASVVALAVNQATNGLCPDPAGPARFQVPVTIGLSARAPAFGSFEVGLDITVAENTTAGTTNELGTAHARILADVGYVDLYEVRVDERIQRIPPGSRATYTITIDNHGNGPTRFAFALAEPHAVPDGFTPTLPAPVVLASRSSGATNASTSVAFLVDTPVDGAHTDRVASIAVVVTSTSATDPALQGAASTIATTTHARGFYVPGAGPLLVLAVVAAGALVIGRRGGS